MAPSKQRVNSKIFNKVKWQVIISTFIIIITLIVCLLFFSDYLKQNIVLEALNSLKFFLTFRN